MEIKKFKITEEFLGIRVDVFLAGQLKDYSRTRIQELINLGKVFVNGLGIKANYCLKTNDEAQIELPQAKEFKIQAQKIPLEIVYEDDDLIVVNKSSGMVVHPGAGNKEFTLVNALLNHTARLSDINPERPGIVHRLDKETSGLIVIAKNNFTHLELTKQFREHSIKRCYIALVKGRVEFKEGMIELPLWRHSTDRKKIAVTFSPQAREAQTYYHRIKVFDGFSLLELIPRTGRTHQLRVHLSYLKHPILGDSKYGNKNDFSRLALHAKDLGFLHPGKNKFIEFTCELPREIRDVIGNIKL